MPNDRLAHNIACGTVIARRRRRRAWSQEMLAFEADLSRAYVSLLERGQRSPTLDTLMALCTALEVPFDHLAHDIVAELGRVEGCAACRP